MPNLAAIPRAVRTIGPVVEPITPSEAKKQLEIPDDDTQHDSYLGDMIAVARDRVEHDTGVICMSSTWTYKLDCWPYAITLPVRPLVSVSSIAYLDTAGASQTLASGQYAVDTSRVIPIIWPAYEATWPALRGIENAITVTFVAGYSSPQAMPPLLRHAVRLALAVEFEDRTGIGRDGMTAGYERIAHMLSRASYP